MDDNQVNSVGYLSYATKHHREIIDKQEARIDRLEERFHEMEIRMAKIVGLWSAIGGIGGSAISYLVISFIKQATNSN